MRNSLVMAMFVLLAACARTPAMPDKNACIPPPITAMLRIEQAKSRPLSWIVQSAVEPNGYTWVFMSEVGMPGFTAVWDEAELRVERRPFYQGPDPRWLVWGFYWWQLQHTIGVSCSQLSGYTIKTLPEGREIWRGKTPVWQWLTDSPARFTLPAEGLEVDITVHQLPSQESDE